jgi:hypothetical protein
VFSIFSIDPSFGTKVFKIDFKFFTYSYICKAFLESVKKVRGPMLILKVLRLLEFELSL